MADKNCKLCGLPMPEGETMFNYHGYSGPCPGPPLLKPTQAERLADALFAGQWINDNVQRPFLIDFLTEKLKENA